MSDGSQEIESVASSSSSSSRLTNNHQESMFQRPAATLLNSTDSDLVENGEVDCDGHRRSSKRSRRQSEPVFYCDSRYFISFHAFLKLTAIVSCFGTVCCIYTSDHCSYEVGTLLDLLLIFTLISLSWTFLFYFGHLCSLQRHFKQAPWIFLDVVFSGVSFILMIVASSIVAHYFCYIDRFSILGSSIFGITAGVAYLTNFIWLTWKYYLNLSGVVSK